MHRYTRHLLTVGLVACSTIAVNPCQAQTLTNSNGTTDTIDNSSAPSSLVSETNADTSKSNNSDSSSQTVSQTPAQNTTAPSTRIPISSRIFPVPSMQQ